ncbi:MAG: hypothetical protein RR718_01075, partial [Comamonas sp.]
IVANGFRMYGGNDGARHVFSQSDLRDSGTVSPGLRDITASHLSRGFLFLGIAPADADFS